jgi:choline-sulfatase
MRILYIDIDSLRPDHLGCYGYLRDTSPNIDSLAAEGTRFTNYYVSDAPCLPSRSALWSGRHGFHTGVINHGGTAGQPFVEGPERGFRDLFGSTSWMSALRQAGLKTVTVSPFGERHCAWHWYAGYNEVYNTGRGGMERAGEMTPVALDWLERNGAEDNWFLHVNMWDPHTPYRTPEDFGDPFADDPLPEHFTEEFRQQAWNGYGPHSPQELYSFDETSDAMLEAFPRAPGKLDSMDAIRRWINAYDTGIRYADEHIGQLMTKLKDLGIYDDTLIIVSADHGENQGELNVWGDHQTADQITCRVPLVVRWPEVTTDARIDSALHYHFDWAATVIELAGGQVPSNWDGIPFTEAYKGGDEDGRAYIVTSQGAWACQRGVRFNHEGREYMALRSYHDGYKMVEPLMLFDLTDDPHERNNIAGKRPDLLMMAMGMLEEWWQHMMATSRHDVDPMMTVLREGGALHTRDELPAYLKRLRETGRQDHAALLESRHPGEAKSG